MFMKIAFSEFCRVR